MQFFLHRQSVAPEQVRPDAAGKIQHDIGRADQRIRRLINDVAVFDGPTHISGPLSDQRGESQLHAALMRNDPPSNRWQSIQGRRLQWGVPNRRDLENLQS